MTADNLSIERLSNTFTYVTVIEGGNVASHSLVHRPVHRVAVHAPLETGPIDYATSHCPVVQGAYPFKPLTYGHAVAPALYLHLGPTPEKRIYVCLEPTGTHLRRWTECSVLCRTSNSILTCVSMLLSHRYERNALHRGRESHSVLSVYLLLGAPPISLGRHRVRS